jgi:hypothetical protein
MEETGGGIGGEFNKAKGWDGDGEGRGMKPQEEQKFTRRMATRRGGREQAADSLMSRKGMARWGWNGDGHFVSLVNGEYVVKENRRKIEGDHKRILRELDRKTIQDQLIPSSSFGAIQLKSAELGSCGRRGYLKKTKEGRKTDEEGEEGRKEFQNCINTCNF